MRICCESLADNAPGLTCLPSLLPRLRVFLSRPPLMRSVSLALLGTLALALLGAVVASTRISSAPQTMVLIDDNSIKTTHSDFFHGLASHGHRLSFVNIKEDTVTLKEYDKWTVDNLIIFAPSLEDLGSSTPVSSISSFVDDGGSLLLASSATLSEPLRALSASFGVDFDEDNTLLTDASTLLPPSSLPETAHAAAPSSPIFTAAITPSTGSAAITGASPASADRIAFSGLGLLVAPGSRFTKPALRAPATTVSGELPGADVSLIAASQSLTGARALFAGSLALFSNAYAAIPGVSNRRTAAALGAWVCHDAGHVRVSSVTHHLAARSKGKGKTEENPAEYRIMDEVEFKVKLEQYDGSKNEWVPFVTDKLLFELTLIDPFIREQFPPVAGSPGTYALTKKLPDSFGVYKLRVTLDQFRDTAAGFTFIEHEVTVPVRPFAHNEYPRFLLVAYPYYVSAFAVTAAFFVFCAAFLLTKDTGVAGAAATSASAKASTGKKAD